MFKDIITYTDFDGNACTADVYFNMSKTEYLQWMIETNGSLTDKWTKLIESDDTYGMISALIEIINRSYGVKSDDGKKFVKNDEVLNEFTQSCVYDAFIEKLLSEPGYNERFIKGIIPVSGDEWNNVVNQAKIAMSSKSDS